MAVAKAQFRVRIGLMGLLVLLCAAGLFIKCRTKQIEIKILTLSEKVARLKQTRAFVDTTPFYSGKWPASSSEQSRSEQGAWGGNPFSKELMSKPGYKEAFLEFTRADVFSQWARFRHFTKLDDKGYGSLVSLIANANFAEGDVMSIVSPATPEMTPALRLKASNATRGEIDLEIKELLGPELYTKYCDYLVGKDFMANVNEVDALATIRGAPLTDEQAFQLQTTLGQWNFKYGKALEITPDKTLELSQFLTPDQVEAVREQATSKSAQQQLSAIRRNRTQK